MDISIGEVDGNISAEFGLDVENMHSSFRYLLYAILILDLTVLIFSCMQSWYGQEIEHFIQKCCFCCGCCSKKIIFNTLFILYCFCQFYIPSTKCTHGHDWTSFFDPKCLSQEEIW